MNDEAKRIVDVIITRESSGVTSANFSTPLFLRKTTGAETLVQTFSSAKEVGTAYTTTSPEYYASVAHYGITGAPRYFKIATAKTGDSVTTALDAIYDIDSDWYGLVVEDISAPANLDNCAGWCGTNDRFLFTGSSSADTIDTTIGDTTSASYFLNLASRKKSHVLYNTKLRDVASKEGGFADVALASYALGKTVGSYTLHGKTLSGMLPDKLSTTTVTNLSAKNTSWYNTMYGVNIVEGARTCGGTESDWVDVEIGIDWLSTRIQESVLNVIFNSDKIAYTEEGIQKLVAPVKSELETGVKNGLLASYQVTTEPVTSQSAEDKANRVYNGITFTAVLAGAIHSTTINGKVSV